MQAAPFPLTRSATKGPQAWRLQDAKSQFSALVDNALRGVPQHVTRRGKVAVVVLSEQDFEALQRGAANRAARPASFIEHLLAMPKESVTSARKASGRATREASQKSSPKTPVKAPSRSTARKAVGMPRLDVQPRDVDWS